MTLETWMAFCAASVPLILLPSPLSALVARFALQKGRSTAFLTLPGAGVGLGAALVVASAPILALSMVLPQVIPPLSWVGLAYLMLYVLWSFQEPALRGPMSANDNLPARKPVAVFVSLVFTALGTWRYVAAVAALFLQFAMDIADKPIVLLEMQAAFLLVIAFGGIVHVVFPNWTLRRRGIIALPGPASHKLRTRFIARRAVTAGYRRIAA